MNTSNLHYRGFVDTFTSMGLSKEAASSLYKQAVGVKELITLLIETK